MTPAAAWEERLKSPCDTGSPRDSVSRVAWVGQMADLAAAASPPTLLQPSVPQIRTRLGITTLLCAWAGRAAASTCFVRAIRERTTRLARSSLGVIGTTARVADNAHFVLEAGLGNIFSREHPDGTYIHFSIGLLYDVGQRRRKPHSK